MRSRRSHRSLKLSHTQTSVPCGTLNSIGQTIFELESRNENVDGWTDKRTNKRTELHQFRKDPCYDGDLCPCQV